MEISSIEETNSLQSVKFSTGPRKVLCLTEVNFTYRFVWEEKKKKIDYRTQINIIISQKKNIKDLRVIISDDLTFTVQNNATITFTKMLDWILRTLKTRATKAIFSSD